MGMALVCRFNTSMSAALIVGLLDGLTSYILDLGMYLLRDVCCFAPCKSQERQGVPIAYHRN